MKIFYQILIVLFSLHILTSTDCHGFPDYKPEFSENPTVTINFDNSATFNVGDTIKIFGRSSTMVYNIATKDSVKLSYNPRPNVAISKLVTPNSHNLIRARNKFDIIAEKYLNDDVICSNYIFSFSSKEDSVANLFRYELFLVPKESGDFIIHFTDSYIFENIDKKQSIVSNYPINNMIAWFGRFVMGETQEKM